MGTGRGGEKLGEKYLISPLLYLDNRLQKMASRTSGLYLFVRLATP